MSNRMKPIVQNRWEENESFHAGSRKITDPYQRFNQVVSDEIRFWVGIVI